MKTELEVEKTCFTLGATMDSIEKLQEISLRLDHMQAAGDWLARSLVHSDSAASHTGTLITVLTEDIRERLLELVTELEKQAYIAARDVEN